MTTEEKFRAQELCESWGSHPGLPVPNSLYSLCGPKTTLNLNWRKDKHKTESEQNTKVEKDAQSYSMKTDQDSK